MSFSETPRQQLIFSRTCKRSPGAFVEGRRHKLTPSLHTRVPAVTISTRYLHSRRQFANPELKKGEPGYGVEHQVISYPGVYMRVLPQIARAYVFITAGKDMVSRASRRSWPECSADNLHPGGPLPFDGFAAVNRRCIASRRNSRRLFGAQDLRLGRRR